MKFRIKVVAAFLILLQSLFWSASSHAVLIVETFEGFTSGDVITTELAGLSVTAANGGDAEIAIASNPVVPGEPGGIFNNSPGVFSIGFEFALIFDFLTSGTSIGAFVDFGNVGTGLTVTAFDGLGGTGSVLGSQSTSTEGFIGVTSVGIQSAVFAQAGMDPASWLLDNLTYETSVAAVPEPSPIALLGAGVIAFGVMRRKKLSPNDKKTPRIPLV